MKFYVQIDKDGILRDAITYPYGDYVEMEIPTPLPDGAIGGWYRVIDGELVFDQELYEKTHQDIPERSIPIEIE